MSSYRKFSTPRDIKKKLKIVNQKGTGAGATLFYENGIEYTDDSESHMACIGRTGVGKSQCVSSIYIMNIIRALESGVIIDPKGELLKSIMPYIPDIYKVYCIDLTNPSMSPTKWNPIRMAYELYRSKDILDNDDSYRQVNNIYDCVYPFDKNAERFWNDSAINFAKGVTYSVFDLCKSDEINMVNISKLMQTAESIAPASSGNSIRVLYEFLDKDSLAKTCLSSYVSAPPQTRGSIHTSALCNIEMFSKSKGLQELICGDTLDVLNMDLDNPFLIFVLLPDESNEYHSLAGLLINQLSLHMIREARKNGGKLNRRVNFVLEELGSIGRSIPNLPFLMAAGRSRGIRILLVFQSYAQLKEMYGENNAETIISCIGISICFSTNHQETLDTWSNRCGKYRYYSGEQLVSDNIIHSDELASMGKAQALILIDGGYKYITRLPMFYELFTKKDGNIKFFNNTTEERNKMIDYDELIKRAKNKNDTKTIKNNDMEEVERYVRDALSKDNKPRSNSYKFNVTIINTELVELGMMDRVIDEIKKVTKEDRRVIKNKLEKLPYKIICNGNLEALCLERELNKLNVIAILDKEE